MTFLQQDIAACSLASYSTVCVPVCDFVIFCQPLCSGSHRTLDLSIVPRIGCDKRYPSPSPPHLLNWPPTHTHTTPPGHASKLTAGPMARPVKANTLPGIPSNGPFVLRVSKKCGASHILPHARMHASARAFGGGGRSWCLMPSQSLMPSQRTVLKTF